MVYELLRIGIVYWHAEFLVKIQFSKNLFLKKLWKLYLFLKFPALYLQKNAMKEEIIAHAIPLFFKYGFKSVTMDDIAQDMAASKKTLYCHYATKEALVKAASLSHLDLFFKKVGQIAHQAKDPIIELYLIKKEALKFLTNETTSPVYQLQKYYPAVFKVVKQEEFKYLSNTLKNSLEKGINMGVFRPNIDIGFVTRIFFNGIRGITDYSLFPIEHYKIDDLLIAFSEYHLRAICSPKGIEILENYIADLNI